MGFGSRHMAETDATAKKMNRDSSLGFEHNLESNFCTPNKLSECHWISKNIGNLHHLMAQLHIENF